MAERDLRTALIAGIDIPIPECRLVLTQPKIKDIAFLDYEDFLVGLQTLSLYKSMFASVGNESFNLDEISIFEIFMTIINEMPAKKESVRNLMFLLFPNYDISFTSVSLNLERTINGEKETSEINQENFEIFQDIFRQVFCLKDNLSEQSAFNPADKKAKEIAEKLMRGRERVAAQRGSSSINVFNQYVSILTVGLQSMSIHDLLNCTMYQLYDLMERYSLYLNWDMDLKVRLAGGKPDSKVENWMKPLH